MENIEMKDLNTTEVVEDVAEAITTGGSGLKNVAKIGLIGAASIAVWELAVKPVSRKISSLITGRKVARMKKAETTEKEEEEENDDFGGFDDLVPPSFM